MNSFGGENSREYGGEKRETKSPGSRPKEWKENFHLTSEIKFTEFIFQFPQDFKGT